MLEFKRLSDVPVLGETEEAKYSIVVTESEDIKKTDKLKVDVDTTVIAGSTNPVSGGAVHTAITDLHIGKGTGTGATQQTLDGGNTLDFTDKNIHITEASQIGETDLTNIARGARGDYSSSFGGKSVAKGKRSVAEGTTTIAVGDYSHVEGANNVTLGADAHAEGCGTLAEGMASHSEGTGTAATGIYSHAEGNITIAAGTNSHAEGYNTKTVGNQSHAEGHSTIANGHDQHVQGTFNIADTTSSFIIGNGTDENNRSNALTVDWQGKVVSGTTEIANDDKALTTKAYVDSVAGSANIPVITFAASNVITAGKTSDIPYITLSTNAEQQAILMNANNGIIKLDFSAIQTALQLPVSVVYIKKNTINNLQGHTLYQYEFDYSGFEYENALTQGYIYLKQIGTGGALYESTTTKYLFVTFYHINPVSIYNRLGDLETKPIHSSPTSEQNSQYAHAEGDNAKATGVVSHAEGINVTASGYASHAEGKGTTAADYTAHAEGEGTKALGERSHAEGTGVIAGGNASHAEGKGNNFTCTVAYDTTTTNNVIASGTGATDIKKNAVLWFNSAYYYVNAVSVSGSENTLTLDRYVTSFSGTVEAHVYMGAALGSVSHVEGNMNNTVYLESTTEFNESDVRRQHAEGSRTLATGYASHAEGEYTQAIGNQSHAEGQHTRAYGNWSHAGGQYSKAEGSNSFVHGNHIIATGENQIAFGKYNSNKENALFELGNGTNENNRKDAFWVDKYGIACSNVDPADITFSKALTTKGYIDEYTVSSHFITNSCDIDNLKDTGFYTFHTESIGSHRPTPEGYGEMLVFGYKGDGNAYYSAQIYTPNGDSENKNVLYYRTCNGTTWNEWQAIKENNIQVINEVLSGSTSAVTSGAVYNALSNYSLITETGNKIDLTMDSSTYVVTLKLKDKNNNVLSTGTIDLPLESVVVSGSYDSATKKVILTLKNGSTIEFSVADLVSGLQTEITSSNKLSSDLVDDTDNTNKFVTETEKSTWNNKQNAISDLETIRSGAALGATSIQSHQDISGKQDKPAELTTLTGTVADNTIYRLSNVGTLAITFPEGHFNSIIFLTTATSGVNVTFSTGAKFMGTAPTIGTEEEWVITITDGIVGAIEVGDGT